MTIIVPFQYRRYFIVYWEQIAFHILNAIIFLHIFIKTYFCGSRLPFLLLLTGFLIMANLMSICTCYLQILIRFDIECTAEKQEKYWLSIHLLTAVSSVFFSLSTWLFAARYLYISEILNSLTS